MKSKRFSLPLLTALAVSFSLAVCAEAQTFTILAGFSGGNGSAPFYGSLIQATNGNYYGTTHEGGKYNGGTVFQVTPAGKLNDIYSFCAKTNCTDGQNPWSALVLGSDGNLYGTTNVGGSYGSGTVFKMTIGGKLTTLYSFCPVAGCADGQYPVGLMQASNGNFYGTTSDAAGNQQTGTIFEISSVGKFKLLYTFCSKSHCTDGGFPLSGPVQASNGNLYGTTSLGGAHSSGTVYEITTAGLFKTLYSFCVQANCADGLTPFGGLIQDSIGNLYGTTQYGGAKGFGAVFEITTTNQLIILHSFNSTDGAYPLSALILGSDGNFYGTTDGGGVAQNAGTIYEITSAGVFSSLYSFCTASGCTGFYPGYALGQATNGEFIGTTTNSGSGYGTVYSYATGLGAFVQTVPKAAKVGKRVIILGNGLTGSTGVTFNGTSATFTVVSDTEITTTVPTGATTGTVTVTTPAGTLNSNPVFQVLK